ncbi:hypothetical protein [Salinispora arenicola]|uniref:hypothetical protein n=1 Tax=Salinispora arenicola TaxID=168697 RepID=UPI0020796EED|nr:hypothetical protein [Salinispora arenicola]MCN0153287.1 hypothetical protein [Salinispora arenicola]
MSVGAVKATLREGNTSLDQAKMTVEGIGAALAEVETLVLHTLHDSNHGDAEATRSILADATREVRLLLRTIDSAQQQATTCLKSLG